MEFPAVGVGGRLDMLGSRGLLKQEPQQLLLEEKDT